jgi:hypothetical protein
MAFLTPGEIVAGSASLVGSDTGLWVFAGYSGLALAASIVIIAFMYLWGTLFRNVQMLAYVKSELYEVFATGVLVIFLFAALAGMGGLTIGTFIPEEAIPDDSSGTTINTNIYDAAAQYYERVELDMAGWLSMNYVLNMYVDQVASVTPYARPLGVGLVASPMAGLASPIKQLIYNSAVALALAYVVNHAQLVVYIFAVQAFLKYYIPLGVFLRAFTPTRRIGGTLIGVGLTFLFIFPALSVMNYTMFYTKAGGPLLTFRDVMTQFMQDDCNPDTDPNGMCFTGHFEKLYKNSFSGIGSSFTSLVTGTFGGIGKLLQTMVGNVFLMLILFPVSLISMAFAVGFIIPALNILILTQAAKSLSKSFGDEADIGALTRLI